MAGIKTPTNILEAKGAFIKNPQRARTGEPKPNQINPEMPKHLTRDAKRAWERISALLDKMQVLTEVDGVALERLCEVYAAILGCEKDLKKNGRYMQTTNSFGETVEKMRPVTNDLHNLDKLFKSMLSEFGLTPASRSRVKIRDGEKEDPLQKYFS